MADDLFDELFPGELRHDQIADMVAALESRLAAAKAGRLKLTEEELAELERNLSVMRQEEVIAQVVEDELHEALVRHEVERALGEGDEGPEDVPSDE